MQSVHKGIKYERDRDKFSTSKGLKQHIRLNVSDKIKKLIPKREILKLNSKQAESKVDPVKYASDNSDQHINNDRKDIETYVRQRGRPKGSKSKKQKLELNFEKESQWIF